jgi:hypothetical protein
MFVMLSGRPVVCQIEFVFRVQSQAQTATGHELPVPKVNSGTLLSLTTLVGVAIVSNMRTALLLDERRDLAEDRFVELVVWQVPQPVRASKHLFKYRLAFVVDGLCVLRYDNAGGQGRSQACRCGAIALHIYHAGTALRRFHGRRGELENLR